MVRAVAARSPEPMVRVGRRVRDHLRERPMVRTARRLRHQLRERLRRRAFNGADLAGEIARLADRVELLERAFREDRHVGQIRMSGLNLFYFETECAAEAMRAAGGGPDPVSLPSLVGRDLLSAFLRACLAMARADGNAIRLIDVGCHYGTFSMSFAQRMRSEGVEPRVLALDSGPAGALCPANIVQNDLADVIDFVPMAAADKNGFALRETGHPENIRLVDRARPVETELRRAPCRRLDWLCRERGWPTPLAVKIDTRGAEPEVVKGLGGLTGGSLMLMEFTPDAIASRTDPTEFLERLASSHRLARCVGGDRLHEISASDARATTEAVLATESRWDDLLLIPRGVEWSAGAFDAAMG